MVAAAVKEHETEQLIEAAKEAVRCHAVRLSQNFHSITARLPEAILLKEALRRLEDEAARLGFEALSRIAAVLHDVLRYNAIEEFNIGTLQGFIKALQQATDGRADQADPFECELALYQVGLDWLPPVPQWEETELEASEAQDNEDDDSDEE